MYKERGDYKGGPWVDDGVLKEDRQELVDLENGSKYKGEWSKEKS